MPSAEHHTALRQIGRLFGDGTLAELPDSRLLERYVAHRDELAFEALVLRHGAMVLGVCRRVLNDPNDADDAFQAAFLLLARKARSVWVEGSLGGWLHRVAWRIALQVHSDSTRRRVKEQHAAEQIGEAVAAETARDENAALIHQEIDRLPECYRRPVILCYLEEMTYQQAANHLQWSEATTRGRLARARDLLRVRLTRRGVPLTGVAWPGAGLTVPAALRETAVRSAYRLALGETAGVSTSTIVLMKQAARGMLIARVRSAAAAAIVIAALTGLATALAAAGINDDPQNAQATASSPAPAATPPPRRPGKGEIRPIRGRVVTPEGAPAAGADVCVVVNVPRPLTMSIESSRTLGPARTDADGRFLLDVPRPLFENSCMATIVASLPGYAAGLLDSIPDEGSDIAIRLGQEELVHVRLFDLDGMPARRAALRVVYLWTKDSAIASLTSMPDRPLPAWLGVMSADDEGQLTIPGLASGSQLFLEAVDDRYAVQRMRVRARPAAAAGAAVPRFTLTPAHWLEGHVRLGDSGAVAAGSTFEVISRFEPEVDPRGFRISGRTDAAGRFRINVPRCKRYEVLVYPPEGSPFTFRRIDVAATQDASQEVDVTLPRGVLVKGKVVESPSGRAVAGAIVEYRPRREGNPNFHKEAVADHDGYEPTAVCAADGSFRIGVLPGPGHILVKGPEPQYIAAEASEGLIDNFRPGGLPLYPHGLLAVDALAGAEVDATITLRRGRNLRGRIVDPDGRPALSAAVVERDGLNSLPAPKGEFALAGLDAERPVTVYFLDAKKQLGKIATFSRVDFDRPVTVPLERCGSARARFVDANGQPLANVQFGMAGRPMIELEMTFDERSPDSRPFRANLELERTFVVNMDFEHYTTVATDFQGWVTYPSLIPGATYRILAGENGWVSRTPFVAEAGRTLELGAITVNP